MIFFSFQYFKIDDLLIKQILLGDCVKEFFKCYNNYFFNIKSGNMNLNIEPKIFASKSHLKRYWSLNNRIMAYNNAALLLKSKTKDPKQYCIVVIERFSQGCWSDQIYYVPKSATLNFLYRKIIDNSKQSYFFYTPKTRTQILSTKTFQEIYDSFRDPDDNFIYLELVSMDSFGGN